jgi:L-methionine (R)-S-oxide reductase
MKTDSLLAEIEAKISSGIDQKEGLQLICQLLYNRIETYDWVGYYLHQPEKNELVLSAYVGESTEHTNIPFGKGICGQVALSNKNFIVDDVNAQDNYIACSLDVKSEIVIPLFVNDKNIGQIDIDSHQLKAFTEKDAAFLTQVNRLVAMHLF